MCVARGLQGPGAGVAGQASPGAAATASWGLPEGPWGGGRIEIPPPAQDFARRRWTGWTVGGIQERSSASRTAEMVVRSLRLIIGRGGGLMCRAGPRLPPPPRQENDPADAHPSAHKAVLESANPRMDSGCASGCAWSMARATAPSPGRPTPGVVKQDKSSGGSVDTTKTRSGPQRVRMSSGERPIGTAKGKQTDTEALCPTPPPPHLRTPPPPLPTPRGLGPGAASTPRPRPEGTFFAKGRASCLYLLRAPPPPPPPPGMHWKRGRYPPCVTFRLVVVPLQGPGHPTHPGPPASAQPPCPPDAKCRPQRHL